MSFSTCLTIWGVWFTVWLDWMHIVCTVCCTISGSWAIGSKALFAGFMGWVLGSNTLEGRVVERLTMCGVGEEI